MYGIGAEQAQRQTFPQYQQTAYMIYLGVGEQHRFDGRLPGILRPQRFIVIQLLANIRRSVNQYPVYAIAADSDGGLCAGRGRDGVLTNALTDFAIAIPLRATTAGPGAQYQYLH